MSDEDCQPQNPSENDGSGENDSNRSTTTKYELEVGQVSIKAEADEPLEEVSEIVTDDADELLSFYLRGEMQVIEQDDLHSRLNIGD